MKISIITVCLNSAKTIRKALDSVRNQTYKNIEVVVIDGVSTDETLQIVAEYKDIVSTLVSEKDKGIYDAMNKGAALATGDIVFFLNSDDAFYDPSVLAGIVKQFEQTPSIDLLYGNVVFDNKGELTKRTYSHINNRTLEFESLCHQAVFARHTLFNNVGLFNLKFKTNADYDWLIRVFRSGAKCIWFDRIISLFSLGGMHGQNPALLAQEHKTVRLQYMSKIKLIIGDIIRRVRHRWHRHFMPYPLGSAALTSMPYLVRVNDLKNNTIDICIATYKRPVLLKKLLLSLSEQVNINLANVRIIIIDNDYEKSAEETVKNFFADKKITYIYDIQPQKNIALTRNKALDYATADYIAFIDDDEWAASDWLYQLLNAFKTYNADVVFGHVIAEIPTTAPAWIKKGGFFKKIKIKTGSSVQYGATSNVLLKKTPKIKQILQFDPDFGLTGGEDTHLFYRLYLNGAKLITCNEAIVYEHISQNRLTIKWWIKRSLRGGQVYATIIYSNVSPAQKLGIFIKRLVYFSFYFTLFVFFLLIFNKPKWVRALCNFVNNFGQLSTFFNINVYEEYK
jgi:succinoglycan biosynthesis protein ExoM